MGVDQRVPRGKTARPGESICNFGQSKFSKQEAKRYYWIYFTFIL